MYIYIYNNSICIERENMWERLREKYVDEKRDRDRDRERKRKRRKEKIQHNYDIETKYIKNYSAWSALLLIILI